MSLVWPGIAEAARSFYALNGHSDFPPGQSIDGYNLRNYASYDRFMRPYSVARDELETWFHDWTWDQGEADYRAAARAVVMYQVDQPGPMRVVGRVRSSRKWAESNDDVTDLVVKLIEGHRLAELSNDVYAILGEPDGWEWDAGRALWAEAKPVLEKLVALYGSCIPPYQSEPCYLMWIPEEVSARARRLYTQGRLSPDVIHGFESLNGWLWDEDEYNWAQLLQSYRVEFGDGRTAMSIASLDGGALGEHLRQAVGTRNTLPAEQVVDLEALPQFSWDVDEIVLKFVTASIASLDQYTADLAAWSGKAPKPKLRKISRSVSEWIDRNDGRIGVVMMTTENEWKQSRAALPPVAPSDMDTLTEVITFAAENGHCGFGEQLTEAVEDWRAHPKRLHPLIRDAVAGIAGWEQPLSPEELATNEYIRSVDLRLRAGRRY